MSKDKIDVRMVSRADGRYALVRDMAGVDSPEIVAVVNGSDDMPDNTRLVSSGYMPHLHLKYYVRAQEMLEQPTTSSREWDDSMRALNVLSMEIYAEQVRWKPHVLAL